MARRAEVSRAADYRAGNRDARSCDARVSDADARPCFRASPIRAGCPYRSRKWNRLGQTVPTVARSMLILPGSESKIAGRKPSRMRSSGRLKQQAPVDCACAWFRLTGLAPNQRKRRMGMRGCAYYFPICSKYRSIGWTRTPTRLVRVGEISWLEWLTRLTPKNISFAGRGRLRRPSPRKKERARRRSLAFQHFFTDPGQAGWGRASRAMLAGNRLGRKLRSPNLAGLRRPVPACSYSPSIRFRNSQPVDPHPNPKSRLSQAFRR